TKYTKAVGTVPAAFLRLPCASAAKDGRRNSNQKFPRKAMIFLLRKMREKVSLVDFLKLV
ncbi:MAG: hypothetical protein IIU42_05415, partial [Ruminococcus sp.]|nr:hypothetical protein [Ruminococcus sp.]